MDGFNNDRARPRRARTIGLRPASCQPRSVPRATPSPLAHRDADDPSREHRGPPRRPLRGFAGSKPRAGSREDTRPARSGLRVAIAGSSGRIAVNVSSGEPKHKSGRRSARAGRPRMETIREKSVAFCSSRNELPARFEAAAARLLHDTPQGTASRRLGNAFHRYAERNRPSLRAHHDTPASRLDSPARRSRPRHRLLSVNAEAELLERDLELLLGVPMTIGPRSRRRSEEKDESRLLAPASPSRALPSLASRPPAWRPSPPFSFLGFSALAFFSFFVGIAGASTAFVATGIADRAAGSGGGASRTGASGAGGATGALYAGGVYAGGV